MKSNRTGKGLAALGLAVVISGAIGLALPSTAAAAGQSYSAVVTACEGDLVNVPASAFISNFAPHDPMPELAPGAWQSQDEQVAFVSGTSWSWQTDLGGLVIDQGAMRYQIPDSIDWTTVNEIRLGALRTLQTGPNTAMLAGQFVTITRSTDCDEEPPTTSSSEPSVSTPPITTEPSVPSSSESTTEPSVPSSSESTTEPSSSSTAPTTPSPRLTEPTLPSESSPSSSAPSSTTIIVLPSDSSSTSVPTTGGTAPSPTSSGTTSAPTTSPAAPTTTISVAPTTKVVPTNTPPTSVRTSGPLPEGQALWLMLLVAGVAITATGGALALRRRS